MVADHGIDPALIAQAWRLTQDFFALPDAEKQRYVLKGKGGARGYTPSVQKSPRAPDPRSQGILAHRARPARRTSARRHHAAQHLARTPRTFRRDVHRALCRIRPRGQRHPLAPRPCAGSCPRLVRACHRRRQFSAAPAPLSADRGRSGRAIRAGAHEDINLITLLLGAEEAGLELLTREGEWIEVTPPEGALVINIGDMLQRLTNHVLPSTTHRVRNPSGERAKFSRYSMPFFLHLRSDFEIRTLPGCISADNPDRYPAPITADAYLQQRLREIGLIM
jgi:isopenicillin N synthase-like dioxygenase